MSDEKPESDEAEKPLASTDAKDTKDAKDARSAGAAKDAKDAKDAEDEDEDEGEEAEDQASPEAIAKRVEALGEEDELEKIARSEEQKLAERRSKLKKKGGKAALAKAASKRLAEIGEKPLRSRSAAAVDAADPLLARTNQLGKWIDTNQRTVQAGGALVVVGLLATGGYLYYQQKHEGDASRALAHAVADERGTVGEPPPDDEENRLKDPRPMFKTAEDRRESALKKYRDVQARYAGTGAAYLARLGEASVLLDKREADGAIAAYNDVKASPLAMADAEVRGRSTEGLGMAHELKAQLDQAQKEKHLDDALAAYKALENTVDVKGFKELGIYHQSRVFQAKGDKAKAKELLVTLRERLSKPGESHPFPYLEEMASDRLRLLDPSAVPPKPKYNQEQMQRMLQQIRAGGGAGGMEDDE